MAKSPRILLVVALLATMVANGPPANMACEAA
jgi:hypothetical protein